MLAIDPGGTTGWLLFNPVEDDEQLTGHGVEPLEWGEDRSPQSVLNRTWSLLTQERLDGIVIEGWWPREGVRSWEPEAVEIIGACRWMLANDQERFFVQKPSDAMSFGTPAKVDPYRRAPHNVGRGGAGHAVMALKHAVLWTNVRWEPAAPEPTARHAA
jgi:hypothetical protein